jgi:uncharacterized cupin superfamily protein
MELFLSIDLADVAPEKSAPAPEKVVSGDPRFRTWNCVERDGLYVGIWESAPGKWRIT